MQKDQTEAEEVTEKLKTTDRLEGGVCMCAWDSAYVWREMGEGGGGVFVCVHGTVHMYGERWGRGGGCLYVCMGQCVCLERDGGGGCLPFRSSKKQATCESCFAGHSICSAISLHSGISSLFNRQSGMHREQEL